MFEMNNLNLKCGITTMKMLILLCFIDNNNYPWDQGDLTLSYKTYTERQPDEPILRGCSATTAPTVSHCVFF